MTVSRSNIQSDILEKHLKNSEDSKLIVNQIEEIVETKVENKKDIILTKEDKIDLIDRINKAKLETIIWIVGICVLQFVISFMLKK